MTPGKPLKDRKAEKLAQALANPANFGEAVLGFKFYDAQRSALESCMRPDCRVTILAANGGGKTSRILPTLVLWHMWAFPIGKVKVTSGSWPQIETQIWPNIEQHRKMFPKFRWYETPYIEYKDPNGRTGFCHCFTTNNPGFAEGAHEDGEDSPLLYIIDEAKTCPEWLKKVVVGRVRPTRLVLMSSSGFEEGWFWETTQKKEGWKFHRITAEDCDHISPAEIKGIRDEWAQFPEFADSVLGHGFIPLVQDAVINGKMLDECIANPPPEKPGLKHAFCDFAWSTGRNKNTIGLRNGNVISLEASFHCGHLMASPENPSPGIVETFIAHFVRLGLASSQISGDEDGGGKLVMDALDAQGWVLHRVNNQSTAMGEHYATTGAEAWYEGAKKFYDRSVVVKIPGTTRAQLTNRKRTVGPKGKLAIETKENMTDRNVPSPDEADAVIGAMLGEDYGSNLVTSAISTAPQGAANSWTSERTGERMLILSPAGYSGQSEAEKDLWPEPFYDCPQNAKV